MVAAVEVQEVMDNSVTMTDSTVVVIAGTEEVTVDFLGVGMAEDMVEGEDMEEIAGVVLLIVVTAMVVTGGTQVVVVGITTETIGLVLHEEMWLLIDDPCHHGIDIITTIEGELVAVLIESEISFALCIYISNLNKGVGVDCFY